MKRPLALAATLLVLQATAPALAVKDVTPRWMPKRHAGAPLASPTPPPPSGWRLGPTLTFPYTLGLGAAYLWPGETIAYKAGASWGAWGDAGTIGFALQDFRLYGALVYYMVPEVNGGPYVETGLGLARSSGSVIGMNWPVVPHIGFGTNGRISPTLGWDMTFSAAANGLLSLEGGLLF